MIIIVLCNNWKSQCTVLKVKDVVDYEIECCANLCINYWLIKYLQFSFSKHEVKMVSDSDKN